MFDRANHSQAANTERIVAFVLESSGPDQSASLRCHLYVLVHSGEHGREPVRTVELCPSQGALDTLSPDVRQARAERIAKTFLDAADALVTTSARSQMFAVAAYTSSAPDAAPANQCPFRVEVSADVAAGLSDSEGPTERGNNAVMMRAYEIASKTAERLIKDARDDIQKTADRMERVFTATLARNEFLETKMIDMTHSLQDALDRKSEREANAYAKVTEVNREERWWRLAEKEVPKLMDKFGQGPLSNLLRSLKPDQLKLIVPMLPDEQRKLLVEAIDVHLGLNIFERRAMNGPALVAAPSAPTEGTPPAPTEGN